MGFEAIVVIAVIIMAFVLFITEILSIDLVAMLIMLVLVLTGVISAKEGVAGFSNDATITVAAMFVLSDALFRTGVVNSIGPRLAKMIRYNMRLGVFLMMFVIAFISAFVNNTPVVAVFIPVIIKAAVDANISPSKLLMPLSFATILGGTCTLIGTSTNILVSGLAKDAGLPGFSMFTFAPMGLVYSVIGLLFLTFIGVDLIPNRGQGKDLGAQFGIRNYLTEIELLLGSPEIGKRIMDSRFVSDFEMEIIEIRREDSTFIIPPLDFVLEAGDMLKVRCNVEKLKALKDTIKVSLKPQIKIGEDSFQEKNTALVEVIVSPNSEFEGQTLAEVDFKRRYRAVPLAIKHREEIVNENINNTILKVGDVILTEVKKHRLEEFRQHEFGQENPFIVLSEAEIPEYPKDKAILVMLTIAAVVVTASLELVPIMVGSIAACCLLVLTKCIDPKEAYQAIDWKIIFLLAGALSLGVAMQKSGVAKMVAQGLVDNFGGFGPLVLVSALYLTTSLITEIMSNNAAAALLTPIAIGMAQSMGVSPMPFLIAITFGASASFMTPIGYQTNTMIYTAGQYKFMDFVKVGTWLNLLFWIVATILIPIFFPFK
ncbi:MAG: SLC13 family permease [Microscillaceae bacterium]|jgi:di/tricarboxylate transporter|nr:SLC13 family permease [Microscillaceae bacterium]